MSTLTITEFLEARIAEDESVARECLTHQPPGPWMDSLYDYLTYDYHHFVSWNPDRVLAECAAKRAIISLADESLRAQADRRDASALGAELMHNDVLGALAAVYADHPDYDPEWAL